MSGGAGPSGTVPVPSPYYFPQVVGPSLPETSGSVHGRVATVGYYQSVYPPGPYAVPYMHPHPGLYPAPPNPPPSDEYYLNLAIEQSLVEASRQGSRLVAQASACRDVSAKGQAEAQSYKFWTTGCLSYAETVLDGFYWTDDQFPEICDKDQFPPLEGLSLVTVAEDDDREVIHVDYKQDPILDQLRDRAREAVQACCSQTSQAAAKPDKEPKIQALSKIVSEYFGGSFDTEDALVAAWRHTSSSEKKFKGSVVVLLGRLRGGGASRHRALLFKMLADSQHIKCQLLTGRNLGLGVSDDAAMIQLMVGGRYCILDLTHEPGCLIPCDQLQGPGRLSVSTSSGAMPSPFVYTPTALHHKAQSESNLQGSQAPIPRVSQLAVPDLIRLDSGPLAEVPDCSWAKFPAPPSPGMTGSSSEPPGTAAAGIPAAGGAAEGGAGGANPGGGHHGHSHSFDVSALVTASFSARSGEFQRHSHGPEAHALQQPKAPPPSTLPRPQSQGPLSTLLAAAVPHWAPAAGSQPRPHPHPSQPPQGLSGFFPPSGRTSTSGSTMAPPMNGSGGGGSAGPAPESRSKPPPPATGLANGNGQKGKAYAAEANEPFADLSPFKPAPRLAGSVPSSSYMSQQPRPPLQPQQQQGAGAGAGMGMAMGATPRRVTDSLPLADSGGNRGREGAPAAQGHTAGHGHPGGHQPSGAGHPVQHARSASNGSAGMVAELSTGKGLQPPPPQLQGHNGTPADAASHAPHAPAVRQRSPFQTAAFGPEMGHDVAGGTPSSPWAYGAGLQGMDGAGGGVAASACGHPHQQQHTQLQQQQHAGFARGQMHDEQQQQQQQHGFPQQQDSLGHPGPRLQALRKDELVSRMPSLHLGSNKDWEINPGELKFSTCIGRGSYGEVYKGEWRLTDVAIKKFLQEALSKTVVKEFKAEVSIMHTLKHPNIVLFMGAVVQPEQLAIVTQYIPRGALFSLLHMCPLCHRVDISPKRRLAFARDIAKGMHYLHSCSPPIVHRDLKSANLLADKDWTIKVCDFGLSQVKRAAFLTAKTEMGGTAEWMAPEVLRSEACTEKCDLYSYGVVLYELVTGERPWSQCQNRAQVIGLVGYKQQRLELPPDLQPQVARLLTDCWAECPAERPSFAEVLDRLAGLKDEGLLPSPSRMALAREEDHANCSLH